MMFMFEALSGGPEIDDREQHEDERLDEADEDDVERLPDDQDQRAENSASYRSYQRQLKVGETRNQADHDCPGEDVAEEPERERQGFDRLLEDVERREDDPDWHRQLERLREASEVAPPPKRAHAVPLDDGDDDQSHRQGLVEVCVRTVQEREERQRKDLDPVGDQDVEEQRHCQRDDEKSVVRDVGLDQRAQLVVAQFEDGLSLGRFALSKL